MTASTLLSLAFLLPLTAGLIALVFPKQDNLRDGLTFIISLALLAVVIGILMAYNTGETFAFELFSFSQDLSLAFKIEPLGLTFALVASSLWILTHIYAIGYMRGTNEVHLPRFFACFAIAIFATIGIAFSANLLTLFLFYEVLTVSTYPLVAHKETEEAKSGARIYLAILMGTSILFFLPAVVWTYVLSGTMDFTPGGILGGKIDGTLLAILLGLFAFGIGKAALMPFHRWLPAAMVAPTPVSALLHAVAVVKAGVFSILKIGVYIFGIETLSVSGASNWLMWVAAFSILAASLIAMQQDNLKRRLAYSTVSQLSYITLGLALATNMGALGGGLQIVTHAFGKITLFMCAGSIYVATHKSEISKMRGLGHKMPLTFIAFGIGALSIIGLPPLAGSWSKWALMVGAAEADQLIMIGVLMASSLLNVAYLMPIFARGFFDPKTKKDPSQSWRENIKEAPLFCVLPPCITALACFVLFFYADEILTFLAPMVASVPVGQ